MDSEVIKKRTGYFLKEKRKSKKLTQLEVAERFNHSKVWLCEIESGKNKITFDDIIKLCEIYEISTNDVYEFVVKGNSNEK